MKMSSAQVQKIFVFCFLVASLLSLVVVAEEEEKKTTPSVELDTPEGKVYTLDAPQLRAFLPKHKWVSVLFTAPDCGDCQTMEPEFAQAAKETAIPGTPMRLAKVMVRPDTPEEAMAVRYGITGQKFSPGFPTIYLFKNGEMSTFYNWGMNAKSMVKAGAIEDWLAEQAPWKPAPPDPTNGWVEWMEKAEEKAKNAKAKIDEVKEKKERKLEESSLLVV